MENREIKIKELIAAGYIAVDELLKVLRQPILEESDADPLPEKMKIAAQAKPITYDAIEHILSKIQEEESRLESIKNGKVPSVAGFSEQRASK